MLGKEAETTGSGLWCSTSSNTTTDAAAAFTLMQQSVCCCCFFASMSLQQKHFYCCFTSAATVTAKQQHCCSAQNHNLWCSIFSHCARGNKFTQHNTIEHQEKRLNKNASKVTSFDVLLLPISRGTFVILLAWCVENTVLWKVADRANKISQH